MLTPPLTRFLSLNSCPFEHFEAVALSIFKLLYFAGWDCFPWEPAAAIGLRLLRFLLVIFGIASLSRPHTPPWEQLTPLTAQADDHLAAPYHLGWRIAKNWGWRWSHPSPPDFVWGCSALRTSQWQVGSQRPFLLFPWRWSPVFELVIPPPLRSRIQASTAFSPLWC
jgi:hypothetical protein